MTKSQKQFLHWANMINIFIGIVYGVFRYTVKVDGPFGPTPHSWQPFFQYAHILAVPWLVFAVGVIWTSHIQKKIDNDSPKRWMSGYLLIITFFIMTISGYFLQMPITNNNRLITIFIHGFIAALWTLSYLVHYFKKS